VKLKGFAELHAPFRKERRTHGLVRRSVQEIRGISLVFREIWDTTNLNVLPVGFEGWKVKRSGILHLAKNERDMGPTRLSWQVQNLLQ
jgi:hypothetical protein